MGSETGVGLESVHNLLPGHALVHLALLAVVFRLLLVNAEMDARKKEPPDVSTDGLAHSAERSELRGRVLVVPDDVGVSGRMRRREGREKRRVATKEVGIDVRLSKKQKDEREGR